MANKNPKKENLKPIRTEKEARIKGQNGGIKSGEVRRAKKTMKEMLDYLLEKEIENKKGDKASTQEAITIALIKQALNGNVKAYEVIRDTIGEKPENKIKLDGGVEVQKVFVDKATKQAANKHIDDFIDGN